MLGYYSITLKIFIALKLYRVVSKNETSSSKLGVYICCVPDPYLRKNLVSSIGNLNSSLCYQTRVKLHSSPPRSWLGLTCDDGPQVDVSRDQTPDTNILTGACKIISRSNGNQHPDTC